MVKQGLFGSSSDGRVNLTRRRREEVLHFLGSLRTCYQRGEFGPVVHETVPDGDSGSRARYLYFTLAPSINFQRRSEAMWSAAFQTFQDPKTSFVFFPENTDRRNADYATALACHGLATLRQRHTWIWLSISETLRREFHSDPRSLLASCGYDVVKVKDYVTANRRCFPYLSGPKLLNYWLYMVSCFTDAELVNRGAISIIPDVHITRATAKIGLASASSLTSAAVVERVWREFLDGTDLVPCDLHGPLWRWSRLGFPTLKV